VAEILNKAGYIYLSSGRTVTLRYGYQILQRGWTMSDVRLIRDSVFTGPFTRDDIFYFVAFMRDDENVLVACIKDA